MTFNQGITTGSKENTDANKANFRAEINPVRWDMAQFIEIQ